MSTGPDVEAALRTAVGRLRAREHTERFPTTVHVGPPPATESTFVTEPEDDLVGDLAVRIDVMLRLVALDASDAVPVWVTRPGRPEVEDEDHAWHVAAGTATAALGRTLSGFWVVTRVGWLDLATGRSRTWVRLRL